MIHHGDCIEVMATMPEASVDAIVTDPPYGIRFMGKAWDGAAIEAAVKRRQEARARETPRIRKDTGKPYSPATVYSDAAMNAGEYDMRPSGLAAFQMWCYQWAEAAYRVAKPSAYLLAFGGTRTVHRMTCALEDAGWIIRDMLVWGYASGFPKSKASLKPAWEPIVMARKPGPLRMLAIDECRIGYVSDADAANASVSTVRTEQGVNKILGKGLVKAGPVEFDAAATAGRWPANIVLTDPIFDGGIEGVVGGGVASYNPPGVFGQQRGNQPDDTAAPFAVRRDGDGIFGYGDTGTYSRFFLIPKAARSDREPVLGGQLPKRTASELTGRVEGSAGLVMVHADGTPKANPYAGTSGQVPRENSHPTVKPVDLMRHLVRLVTPTGGVVLDPFLGSGTTAIAAEREGFAWIGIEKEAEYVDIANARLNGTQKGLAL